MEGVRGRGDLVKGGQDGHFRVFYFIFLFVLC